MDTGESAETRMTLLEYRQADQSLAHERLREETRETMAQLRAEMREGFRTVAAELVTANEKSGRQLFATWMLVATLLGSAAAFLGAVHFH